MFMENLEKLLKAYEKEIKRLETEVEKLHFENHCLKVELMKSIDINDEEESK